MQNVELQDYPKGGNISPAVDEVSDSDVQQVSGKNYDPTPDKRDMRRLGKRQELKVTAHQSGEKKTRLTRAL